MRAIRLDTVGPPENLKLVEMQEPELTDDGLLVQTQYAGMIYADAEARRGTYFKETKLPWFPGREVAGTVLETGVAVTEYKPGDRVAAIVFEGGCYAEKVLVRTAPYEGSDGVSRPPSDIVRLPQETDAAAALVYLINYRLAHLLVHGWARVPPGSWIAVHGASGGMGSMILELADQLHCKTIALVRNAKEAEFCCNLGAAHTVDTIERDYVEAVREITEGGGVAYSFNGVGGDTINRDAHILAPFGELHLYGYVAGKQAFDPFAREGTFALKTFSADDFFRTPHFAAANQALTDRLARGMLLSPGQILPLAQAAEAHRAMEAGEIIGKLILEP